MKKTELIQLISSSLSSNTMDHVFQWIASDCVYYSSGKKAASGKDDVCAFFNKRKNALARENIACFAYPATIEESKDSSIAIGTECAALCQYDRYNCVGFMTIQTNVFGKIKRFDFHTTPDVTFKTTAPGKFNVTRVPENAHDAIMYRAFAFGIMDEHVQLSRHIQRYDVFRDYVQRVYTFILKNLNNDFNQGITNAGGYLYISAMAAAVQRNTGITLFQFDETVSTSGEIPAVDQRYQQWINEGYETGKKLFFGFIEYAYLRSPKENYFVGQLRQSYMDMLLYGSTQANKDMDSGIPVAEKPEISPMKIAVLNILSSQSNDNINEFAKVFKSYIDDGVRVYMPGTNDSNGFRMTITENCGKYFAAMFSDPSEIGSQDKSGIALTDINNLIEPLFRNPDIDGIIIDPYTACLCLEKQFLLKCALHGGYPETNNERTKPKDWGKGIPKYSSNDLMTPGEIQNFAMHAVIDNDSALQQNYNLVSACDHPAAIPSLIFEKDGLFTFVHIKGYAAMDKPTISVEEKTFLMDIGRKYNAQCYWAPVGFLSSDPERFEACLALKGDGFYCQYEGLRKLS